MERHSLKSSERTLVSARRPARFGAWLDLRLTDASGRVVERRRRHNTVLQAGALLMADLFRGTGGPINRMAVGANPDPEVPPFSSTVLAPEAPDGRKLDGPREIPVPPGAFSSTLDETGRRVVVTARIVVPAGEVGAALEGPIAEAALLYAAEDGARRLYNRVTFEPVEKRAEQELSLYWELSFPFGA